MGWRWSVLLLVLGLIAGCAEGQGGQLVLDFDDEGGDDDAGDDDAGDDDAGDDDAGDDDAGDDDAGDDDAGDDDAGDDDAGDDDTGPDCAWDGDYSGTIVVELGQWPLEGICWAEVTDCDLTGEAELDTGWDTLYLQLSGGFNDDGEGSGLIEGDLGPMGSLSSPWNGTTDSMGIFGEFMIDMGMGAAPGWFEMEPS